MIKSLSKQKSVFTITTLVALLLLFSCGKESASDQNDAGRIKVVSSFSIISEILDEIGGDKIIVHNLVPVGTDPHEFEPRPDDIKFASGASLFFYNGLNLEGGDKGWFMRLVHSVNATPEQIVKVSENIEPLYLSGFEESREVNPHAFVDPHNGILMSETIRDALMQYDQDHADYYQSRAADYITQLREIEALYIEKIEAIPSEKRVFIISEQAFQYVNVRYGLKEGFIWAIDTDENGSPEQIKAAIRFVRENRPPVLFVESNVDHRPMKTVSNETGVPLYSPPLFSDELGRKGHEADSYLAYLRYNIKHIHKGLTGGE